MTHSIFAGSCIFLEKPNRYSITHLWLVLTEPCGEPPEVIIVNLTSWREGVDETVVLNEHDHPYIDHPTVVYYADARIVEASFLLRLIALDHERLHSEYCSPEVLERVRRGFLASPFTKRKLKKYYRANFAML
jgi:hypothetical protein